jgi:hypothetical protein
MPCFIHKLDDYFSGTLVALQAHHFCLLNGWDDRTCTKIAVGMAKTPTDSLACLQIMGQHVLKNVNNCWNGKVNFYFRHLVVKIMFLF